MFKARPAILPSPDTVGWCSGTESSVTQGPSAIRAENGELPLVDTFLTTESGWLYREDKDIVFIKYKHLTGTTDFEVLPPEKVEPTQEAVDEDTASENGADDTDEPNPNPE